MNEKNAFVLSARLLCLVMVCFFLFSGMVALGVGESVSSVVTTQSTSSPGDISSLISSKGYIGAFGAIFLMGILLSFTPCVFPMIPITLAVIGTKGIGNPLKGFGLSVVYVLGIALTYATLGFVAASTGALFGSIMQSPIVLWIVVIVFLVFSLSMFGLFEFQLPSSFTSKIGGLGEKGKSGIVGTFLFGILAGVVAGPCVTPVIFGLLTYVAQSGNQVLGFFMFFTLALGMGCLLIVLGTFPGMITSLPKSGGWMVDVKKLMGILLLGAMFYFLRLLIPQHVFLILLAVTLLIVGVFTGALNKVDFDSSASHKIRKALGLVLAIAGCVFMIFGIADALDIDFGGWQSAQNITVVAPPIALADGEVGDVEALDDFKEVHWIDSEVEGLELAAEEGKFAMIDFWAEWCTYCKQMERQTFSKREVIKESRRFVMIRFDCTDRSSEVARITRKYSVQGLPTIVFVNPDGEIQPDLTQIGFASAEDMLKVMRRVK